jgi:hypothetical protein
VTEDECEDLAYEMNEHIDACVEADDFLPAWKVQG